MKILVVIPTHNRVEFLADALESLTKQTRPADEIIVTGNVGPPAELRAVAKFWYSEVCMADRVNKAIRETECDAYIFLADDDLLDPTFIAKTEALMLATNADVVATTLRSFGIWTPADWTPTAPMVTSLVKKEAWAKAGGYCDSLYFDWDFTWRLEDAGCTNWQFINEPLFLYRRHLAQESYRISTELHKKLCDELYARFPNRRKPE